jgi:Mor family transcriptional regulator
MNKMDRWISEILDRIGVEDLPESYRDVAMIIGVENTIKLSGVLGGLAYYFPQLDKALIKKRDELIRSEFNGANHKPLAKKYGLSEVWIREIVQRPGPKRIPAFEGKERRP